MSSLTKMFRELAPGSMEANAKRRLGATENRGCLGRPKPLPGDQSEHLALSGAQSGECAADLAALRD
jgi:hypothetical protein